MKEDKLTIIIIARNEEEVIKDCLASIKWADEIILLDTGSTDQTPALAQKAGARVIKLQFKGFDFSGWRNRGLKEAQGDWLFYLDADERITPLLKEEILKTINQKPQKNAFAIPRRNFYLGQEMHHGGAWPDYVKRLFKKDNLERWTGQLHEEPVFQGELGHLQEPLIHFTHRDLTSMTQKTIHWSKIEARLLFEAHHPPVTWWRVFKIMALEFWQRGIKRQGWRDGTVGVIEIIFQMFSRAITYVCLWELQNQK